MNNFIVFNLNKSDELMGLSDGELKMLFLVHIYLCQKNKTVFVNNTETRAFASNIGFSRTSVGYSNLLSGLVKKDQLVREAKGVYSVKENSLLFNRNFDDKIYL